MDVTKGTMDKSVIKVVILQRKVIQTTYTPFVFQTHRWKYVSFVSIECNAYVTCRLYTQETRHSGLSFTKLREVRKIYNFTNFVCYILRYGESVLKCRS